MDSHDQWGTEWGGTEWAPMGAAMGGDLVAADALIDDAAPANPLPGLGPSPRLLRSFHWPPPSQAPPFSPSVDSTLTAAPLPRPPASVVNDPRLGLLRSKPHLFSTFSPLDHLALARGLASHPNRRWADSLVESVRDGFWPGHDGSEPQVPPPARKDRLFPKTKEDREVQVAAAKQAVEDGWFSPPFDELEDGMVVNPQFMVRKDGSDPRPVDDHSASGLNEGIKDAPAIYDRVDSLVRLLRYSGLLDDEIPLDAVLWKLDVSSAFKLLLMSPYWQARQVVAIAYTGGAGRLRPRFHIQFRATFSSRASPYLWTSLMSAVSWIVHDRFAADVPYPFAYMDDAFNVDFSGRQVKVRHDGEEREVPVGQARTIEVWDEIGLKWKWKKAASGRQLVVTGLLLDLDSASVGLEPGATDRFATAVAAFLDVSSGIRHRPLRRWRQITGWANWALTVCPWARPLLSPLFAKLGRSSSPYAEVFLNQEVGHALQTFVGELRDGDALDLKDPRLTEWEAEDADLIAFTDACLETTEKDGSGLGFWYPTVAYAEALSLSSCVLHVLDSSLFVQRLLLRTDSASTAYAFSAGGLRHPEVAEMVRVVYDRLKTAKVDLKVEHVRGVFNVTADRLSRDPGASQMRDKGSARTVTFAPRARGSPKPHLKTPFLPIAELRYRRRLLWEAAIAAMTSAVYERAYQSWTVFTLAYAFPPFPSPDTLSLYVTHRAPNIVPSTLAGELSGLAFYFKAIDTARWNDARASPEVGRALMGNTKLNPHTPKKARPVAIEDLERAVRTSLARGTYDSLLWAAMAVVAFFSCSRAQELTTYDNPLFRDSRKQILRHTVRVSPSGFSASLPYHKADPLYTGSKVWYSARDAGDLHKVVVAYLAARDGLHEDASEPWVDEKGVVPLRRWFVERVKARCGAEYTGHSFRAGGATWYSRQRMPEDAIKALGRWKSDAWRDYVRLQPEIALAQRERDVDNLPPIPSPVLPAASLAVLAPFL
ncbi:hypothetical protein JCM1840_002365 [Sporobolomyces johnsonii]